VKCADFMFLKHSSAIWLQFGVSVQVPAVLSRLPASTYRCWTRVAKLQQGCRGTIWEEHSERSEHKDLGHARNI
jgi:hypothetical protein